MYVKGPPRISSPPLQYGMEGQEVQVECLIVSVPPTGKVRWEKDGQLLDIDNNQGIEMIKGARSRCSRFWPKNILGRCFANNFTGTRFPNLETRSE